MYSGRDTYINFIFDWNDEITKYSNGEIDQKLIESQTNKVWQEGGFLIEQCVKNDQLCPYQPC